MIEDQEGLKVCDKAILFSILACCLIAVSYECHWFYNFAIGFSIGGCIWYWAFIWIEHKKFKRKAEKAMEEAEISRKKYEEEFEKKFGSKPRCH